jgi:Tol biopolymer transport system component
MNLEDRSITVLTNGYDNFPVWSPRGNLIAFISKVGANFNVFTIRPGGEDVSQLTTTRGDDVHLSWSPLSSSTLPS